MLVDSWRNGKGWTGWLVALHLFAALCLFGAWRVHTAPVEFTATAVVAVSPRAGQAVPSAAMISLLSTRYVAFASSDETVADLAAAVDLPLDRVSSGLTVTMPLNTTNIYLQCSLPTPALATTTSRLLSELVIAQARTDAILTAEIVVPAKAAAQPDGQRRRRLLTVGLLGLGVLTSFSSAAAHVFLRRGRPRSRRPAPVNVS